MTLDSPSISISVKSSAACPFDKFLKFLIVSGCIIVLMVIIGLFLWIERRPSHEGIMFMLICGCVVFLLIVLGIICWIERRPKIIRRKTSSVRISPVDAISGVDMTSGTII